MTDPVSDAATEPVCGPELAQLVGAARLFGDLLLTELNPASLRALQEPAASEALAALGVEIPKEEDPPEAFFDELAAEYHAALLAPTGGGAPPVASLWIEGRFEGQIVSRLRTLAESAALDFGSEAARGAPVDHLGVLLHLWASCVERAPWVSDELCSDHFAWAEAPLRQMAQRGGQQDFYGSVALAVTELVAVLRETRVAPIKGT